MDILIRKLETLIAILPMLTVAGKLSEIGRYSKMTQHSAHVRYRGCMEQKRKAAYFSFRVSISPCFQKERQYLLF